MRDAPCVKKSQCSSCWIKNVHIPQLIGSGWFWPNRSLWRQSFHSNQKVLEATINSKFNFCGHNFQTFAQLERYLTGTVPCSFFWLIITMPRGIKGRIDSTCNWASHEIPMKWVQSQSKIDAGHVEADNMSHLHKAPWSNTLEIRFAHWRLWLVDLVGKNWRLLSYQKKTHIEVFSKDLSETM